MQEKERKEWEVNGKEKKKKKERAERNSSDKRLATHLESFSFVYIGFVAARKTFPRLVSRLHPS